MRLLRLSAVFMIFVGLSTITGVDSNPCNGTAVTVSGVSGTISSPNYPNNYGDRLNCIWRIETANNTRIQMRFDEIFAVEPSGSTCNYDYIRFGEPYVTRCGTIPPKSYLSATNVLTVSFVSDNFYTMTGFSFNWTEIDASIIPPPVSVELTSDQGQISSPNYPSNYPAFSDYTWKVNVSEGKNIILEFARMFNTEQSRSCNYDYVAISESSTPFSYYDRLYICQFTEQKIFFTNVLYIQFKSDSINNGAGFFLNYSAVVDTHSCNGITQQNGTSGVIQSPMYPGKYPSGLNCIWNVTAPENTVIAVRFNSNIALVSTVSCNLEYLQLFDGPDSSSDQFQRNFCETWAPRSFVTTGNALTVRFVSSGFADFSHIGFSITWTAEEKCKSDEFTCWDGTCIHESGKCNTTLDCPNDIADEASCPKKDSVQCGASEIEPEFKWHSRIIGGYEAVKGSWPWQGHLDVFIRGTTRFICGCVLISNRWVLTAAHCIIPGLKTIATFGDHDMVTVDADAEQAVAAEMIFLHPKYNSIDENGYIYGYDIALLYLESPVNYTKWVKPACFPKYEVMEGEDVVLTGWGRTKWRGSISRVLMQVVSPVVSRENCSRITNIPNMSDSIICTGLPFGGASTCNGDSGGSLLALQNGSWVVAGLTSFGTACGEWHIPTSYANVHNLSLYIDDVMTNGLREIPTFNQVITGETSGIISSPNYGVGNYPQATHMRWYIVADEGNLIQIRFNESFRIYQATYGQPCAGDYLIIYDGSATSSRKYGDKRLCGYSPPLDMESGTNTVIVEFSSDYNFEDVGFSFSWKVVDGCASNEFRCWNKTCLDVSKKCDGVQDCPTKVDEFVCARASPGSQECGKTEIAPQFRFSPLIIGGNNAEKGSWPWQVAIYVQVGISSTFYCGGTLVSESWVLTAANCIVGTSYQVVIGGYNKSSESTSPEEKSINVEVAFKQSGHPGPGGTSQFGMLNLATPVDFTSKWYKPICLPMNGTMYPPAGSTCVITGWGKTGGSQYNTSPDILQQLQVNILSDEECYGGDPTRICVGYTNRDAGICYDDTGGPLVCEKDGKWVQYGIALFHIGNCGHRSIFERVSLHTNAIVNVINNLEVCKEFEIIEGVTTGEIAPPIVNGEYLQSISCSWLIRGPPNSLIIIRFEFFETQDCDHGIWDFVSVYDGNSTLARKVYDTTLCGNLEGIRGFESSSNEVLITFHSDSSVTAKGFKVHFSIVEDCQLNQFRCWNGTCIDQSLHCDGKSDCSDQSDEKECAIRDGECGKQEIVPEFLWHARIVGGHYAKNGSWPFVVQVEDFREGFICAGTIVNDRWILTLASSIQSKIPEDLTVIVGTNELTPVDAVKYQVEETRFPSQFWMDYVGAIGLLKLKTSISYSDNVQPACLSLPNTTTEPQPGEYCVALGWGGSTEPRTTGPLRQGLVPILPESVCASKRTAGDSNRTFCSGDNESGGTGACNFDEGGPVMCFRDNVWVQSGLITDSNSCGKLGVFEFYTRVSAYANWIQRAMNMTLPTHTVGATSTMTPSVTSTTTNSMTSTTSTHAGMTDSTETMTTSPPSLNTTSTSTMTTTETTGPATTQSVTTLPPSMNTTSTSTLISTETSGPETTQSVTTSPPSLNTTSTSTIITNETTGPATTQSVSVTTSGATSNIPLHAVLVTVIVMVFQKL